MNSRFGIETKPEPAPEPVESGNAKGWRTRRKLDAFLSRRRLMQFAAGGIATGVLSKNLFNKVAAIGVDPAIAPLDQQGIPIGILPRPMEEEPLPREVHLPAAGVSAPAGVPASQAKLEPDATAMPNMAAAMPPTAAPAAAMPPPAEPPTALARPVPTSGTPAWLKNALPYVETKGVPTIAVVIDDLGLDAVHSRQALALDGAVTLAFMTYAPNLPNWTGAARGGKHEILVHVPMQPLSPKIDPGPNALTVALSDAEILDRLRWGLSRMEGYIGINNHMGSRFTEDRAGMSVVLQEVNARGLLYLDSVTTGHSICGPTAAALRMPFAERNVFLDNEITIAGVTSQIAILEKVARRHGTAIAIGHPHAATLQVLAQWLPLAASRGLAVVPLTSVMRRSAMKV